MAKPGPKPTPTHLKVVRGNPGKRALPKNEPKPSTGKLTPPSWLPKEAKAKFTELLKDLPPDMVTKVDTMALAAVCVHWHLAAEAMRQLSTEGGTTVDERGLPRKHPAHQILRDNLTALRQWSAEFGLTPSSRSRLSLGESGGETLDDFLDAPARHHG